MAGLKLATSSTLTLVSFILLVLHSSFVHAFLPQSLNREAVVVDAGSIELGNFTLDYTVSESTGDDHSMPDSTENNYTMPNSTFKKVPITPPPAVNISFTLADSATPGRNAICHGSFKNFTPVDSSDYSDTSDAAGVTNNTVTCQPPTYSATLITFPTKWWKTFILTVSHEYVDLFRHPLLILASPVLCDFCLRLMWPSPLQCQE